MGVTVRGTLPDHFAERLPYMHAIMMEEYGEPDSLFESAFNVESSERMREQTTGVSGFGLPVEKPEQEPVFYDKPIQAFDRTFEHTEYALGYMLSKRMRRDDLDGVAPQLQRALGRSMRTGKNIVCWGVFNNGFTTELTPDGVPFFSAAHPLLEGGTFSNIIVGDLSISTLETAMNRFADTPDHRGLLLEIAPERLIVPYELSWVAREILRSPDKPDTANRAINVLAGELGLTVVKWLTGDDDWFVGASPGNHSLMLFNREQMEMEVDSDFDTGAIKFKAEQSHSQGPADWRGWVGGQGT